MDWLILSGMEGFIKHLVEQAINLFLSLLSAINGVAIQVLDLPVVAQGILYSQALAGTILATKIAYEAWVTHVLRLSGDPDADPVGLFFRSAAAVAFVAGVPWFVRWMYQFGTSITADVAVLPGVMLPESGSALEAYLNIEATFSIYLGIAILFALLIFVIILIQTFIRAAELAVVAVVGSFMALGLTNPQSSAFGSWFKELLSLSMAQAVQMYLIKVSFFSLTYFSFGDLTMFNLFIFCGCLWVTYKSPSILKQYVYSTGVGKAVGSTAQSTGSMILMRRVMTRGK